MWLYRQGLTTRSRHSDMHSIANDIAEAMVGGDQLCVKQHRGGYLYSAFCCSIIPLLPGMPFKLRFNGQPTQGPLLKENWANQPLSLLPRNQSPV